MPGPAKPSCACAKKCPDAPQISSPINIDDEIAKPAPEELKEPWEITGSDKMLCTEIRNDGQQIHLKICRKQSPIIRGGGLTHTEYVIDHIDFHWGSAHTLNCERFPLETHIMMYCSEFCGMDEALEKEGAAAFSILHEFADITSCGVCKLLPFIPQICACVDKAIPYCVITLKDFLPEDTASYFRYTGSATFEPYKPGIEWSIFTQKVPITRMDLGKFTCIKDAEGKLIVSNFRELQPIPPGAEIYCISGGGKDAKSCCCTSK